MTPSSIAGTTGDRKARWIDESGPYASERHGFRIDRVIFARRTAFQDMLIAGNAFYGKMLFIDGSQQSTARDEYIYHEALIHPAMCLHPDPREVLLLGGGPGAALREILRHRTVAAVTMVDLDGELVEACRRFLPEWSQGAFEDPRVRLVIGDGKEWIRKTGARFDVVVMDLTDHVDLGHSFPLFSRGFFRKLKARLKPGGIVVVQSGSLSGVESFACASIQRTLADVFGHACAYSHLVPSFFSEWSFVMASEAPLKMFKDIPSVDRLVAARVNGELRFYDGGTHFRMLLQPGDVRAALADGGCVIVSRRGFAGAYARHYASLFTLGPGHLQSPSTGVGLSGRKSEDGEMPARRAATSPAASR